MSAPDKSSRTAAQRASDANREQQMARNGRLGRKAPAPAEGPPEAVAYKPMRKPFSR